MNRKQLIEHIVFPVLVRMGHYSVIAENLLIMIAAHESRKGYFIKQDPGPAVGIYQMEPRTHADIITWLERDRPELLKVLMEFTPVIDAELMAGNYYYSTFMARCFFLRFPEALPYTEEDMAAYAKRRWNTKYGKATPEDYLEAFRGWK